jgi:hypothetical protein
MVAYPRPFDRDDLEVLASVELGEHELFGFDGYVIVYMPAKKGGVE